MPKVTSPERIALILKLAGQGIYRAEIMRAVGVSHNTVTTTLLRHGVEIPRKDGAKGERTAQMAGMYRQGVTLEKIGQTFDLTRERVRQLLAKNGMTRLDGGQSKQSSEKRSARQAQADAKALLRFGVTHAEKLNAMHAGLLRVFDRQQRSASDRGITWSLTLAQWLRIIWHESGKLELRGRGKGRYCMSRIKDEGGYSVGNVHIQLATDNSKEAVKKWKGKTKTHRGVFALYPGTDKPFIAKVGKTRLGRFRTIEEAVAAREAYAADHGIRSTGRLGEGRGWTFVPNKCKAKPYKAQCREKNLGYFATPEEARGAYLAHAAMVSFLPTEAAEAK